MFWSVSVKNTPTIGCLHWKQKQRKRGRFAALQQAYYGVCVPTFSELILQENIINLFSYFKPKFITNKLLGKSWNSTHRGQILNNRKREACITAHYQTSRVLKNSPYTVTHFGKFGRTSTSKVWLCHHAHLTLISIKRTLSSFLFLFFLNQLNPVV